MNKAVKDLVLHRGKVKKDLVPVAATSTFHLLTGESLLHLHLPPPPAAR